METCAECGKPIEMGQGSFYIPAPAGADFGKTYHSGCGDPLGIKAAIAAERERCAKICDEAAAKQAPGDHYAAAVAMTIADLIREPVE